MKSFLMFAVTMFILSWSADYSKVKAVDPYLDDYPEIEVMAVSGDGSTAWLRVFCYFSVGDTYTGNPQAQLGWTNGEIGGNESDWMNLTSVGGGWYLCELGVMVDTSHYWEFTVDASCRNPTTLAVYGIGSDPAYWHYVP